MISRILAVVFATCIGACAVQTAPVDEPEGAAKSGTTADVAEPSPAASKVEDDVRPTTKDAFGQPIAWKCAGQPQPWSCGGGPTPAINDGTRNLERAVDLGAAANDDRRAAEPLVEPTH